MKWKPEPGQTYWRWGWDARCKEKLKERTFAPDDYVSRFDVKAGNCYQSAEAASRNKRRALNSMEMLAQKVNAGCAI